MSSPALDAALQRLSAALSRLEDTVERRAEEAHAGEGRDAEVHALAEDRARLAQELDDSFARYARLDEASRDVSRRLDHAMAAIRSVVEPQEA